ncbi:hypothetical protein [Nocardia sp. NPDC048505]|uniref:hypothetical protein n=1 Tax=unclassified Nocardia TaxID=2637762 RepID=UPI00340E987F
MTSRATRFAVASAAAAIMFAGAAPAIAAPQVPTAPVAPVAQPGDTGSSALDTTIGLFRLIMCGPWGAAEPHPNPVCR